MSWAGVLWPTLTLLPRLAVTAKPHAGMHRWARRLVPALGLDLELRGHLRHDAPLWVANHLSWVDPVVLMSFRPMGTIAKVEITGYPILGRWARKTGVHFVERGDATSRAATLANFSKSLLSGQDMLLFPEGTTTRGDRLAKFYEGGLKAAYQLGIPAQPLRISSPHPHYPWIGDDPLLLNLKGLFGTRTALLVDALEPLHPSDFSGPAAWIDAFKAALAPRSNHVG
jgi:1-acyl-sn-glycerol-3-phosphate acyltransferase